MMWDQSIEFMYLPLLLVSIPDEEGKEEDKI